MLNTMKTLAVIAALLLAASPVAQANPFNGFAARGPFVAQGNRISASEAAARVQASEGGKILAVETIRGGDAYRVKVLNRKGQVRVIVVNAKR